MPQSPSPRPTVAASEDMDYLYVLVDHHAPTARDAVNVLISQAREQWEQHLERHKLPRPVALWYKDDGDTLQPCAASDPDADSRWWVFPNIPADAFTDPAIPPGAPLPALLGDGAEQGHRRLIATLQIVDRLCRTGHDGGAGEVGARRNHKTLSGVAADPSDPPETL